MAIPTIPLMIWEFEISVFWGAQIITAWSIGALMGTPPLAGMITDRFGARIPLLAGPVLIVATGLAITFSPWFCLVLASMMLAGMGHGAWIIDREIAGVEMVSPDQRGRMMSAVMGTNAMGMALGPVLGGVVGDSLDLRAVFVGYAIAGVLVFTLSLKPPVKRSGPADRPARARGTGQPVLSIERFTALPRLIREIEPNLRSTYLILVYATFNTKLYRSPAQHAASVR